MLNSLKLFKIIALAEGISFLVLVGIAMPLKYLAGQPEAVRIAGSIHGGLFILYLLAIIPAAYYGRWTGKWIVGAIAASILPFGPFVFEAKLKREQERRAMVSPPARS